MTDTAIRLIRAAAALMLGRRQAIAAFDFSADGFWASFAAILIALPALSIGWVIAVERLAEAGEGTVSAIGLAAVAVSDIVVWVLPLALFAVVAGPLGWHDRFVRYTVVTNWGSVPLVWIMLPALAADRLLGAEHPLTSIIALVQFALSMLFTWRLTDAAIDRGPLPTAAVFAAMFVAGFATMAAAGALFGF